jgi:hypothetical protein
MKPWTLLDPTLKNLFYPPEKEDYTYFRDAAEYPFAGGSCIAKAAWAADAAVLAYARYGSRRMTPGELGENLARGGLALGATIGDWDSPGTQGFFLAGKDFATHEDFALLAFRGTEKDDPVDIEDDLDLLPVRERNYRSTEKHHGLGLSDLSLSLPQLVHQGFQRALDSVWERDVEPQVTAYRKSHPNAEICFTGHSLGAALAVLAFSRFEDDNNSLYTFGCPRVGNGAFQQGALARAGRGTFRFVNLEDTVTHIPPESTFYKHVPVKALRFDENGGLAATDATVNADLTAFATVLKGLQLADLTGNPELPAPPGAVDHSPARYCMRLWNYVGAAADQTIENLGKV